MKWIRNILLLYLCLNLFGGNLVSYIYKFQNAISSLNMAEEEDDAAPEKERSDSKEEKFHCTTFELTAAITYLGKAKVIHNSDDKMINHSFEIASPPPNC